MRMNFKLTTLLRKLSSPKGPKHGSLHSVTEVDVREEYANAFRTESYTDFWTHVLSLNNATTTDSSSITKTVSSTTAARLPSYRLFAEHLLEPDQSTVTKILALAKNRPEDHSLFSDYFSTTANASLLCSSLLKDIDHLRANYRSLKSALKSLQTRQSSSENICPMVVARLTHFSKSFNSFIKPVPSPHGLQAVQVACFELLKRLELSRDNAQAKLRTINKLKFGTAVSLVVLTVSLTVIAVTHGLAMLVAAPAVAFKQLVSSGKLAKLSAQLDVAAKGTYILNRDLDTISWLVVRLKDELEDMGAKTRFWVERGNDRIQAIEEFGRQVKKKESSFSEQVDELEEHLYLCFMTINRARNLVIKEIIGGSAGS